MSLEDQIQDLKKELTDKDKKIKLAEFRSNKVIKEHVLLLETEKIKLQESQEMCVNLQKQVKDLMEKNIESDKTNLKLREEIQQRKQRKSDHDGSDDENSFKKKFMPRMSMIQRAGNDLSQFPSYNELVTMIQNQSGDNSALQEEAIKIVENLQGQINTLQQELNQSDLRIAELTKSQSGQDAGLELQLQNLYDEFEGFRKKTDVEKYDLQRKIKNLSEQIDDIRQKNTIEFEQFQDQVRNEFELKSLENEHSLNKQKSDLLMDLDNNEEKLRQYESQINEMNNQLQDKIDQLEKIHKSELQQKNSEIQSLNEQIEKNTKQFKDQLHKQHQDLKNSSETVVRDLKFQIDDQKLNIELLNKKLLRLEQDKERRDIWIEEFKKGERDLKNELQSKDDKINLIIEDYESKLQEQSIVIKNERKNFDIEIQSIHQSYEMRINELELNNNQKNSFINLQTSLGNNRRISNISEKDILIIQIQEEIKDIKQENEILQQKISDCKIELDSEKEANKKIKQDLDASLIQINQLDDQKEILKQNIEDQQLNIKKLSNQHQNMIQENEQLNETNSQLKNDLNQQISMIQQLTNDQEQLKTELNSKLIQLLQQEKQLINLSSQKQILIDSQAKFMDQIQQLQEEVLKYKQNQRQRDSSILSQKKEIQTLLDQQIKSKQILNKLQEEKEHIQNKLDKMNDSQSDDEDNQELIEQQKIIIKLNEKERELQKQLNDLSEISRQERSELKIKVMELETQISIIQEELILEREEKLYAEKVAATVSIKVAQTAMDLESQIQETKHYYKIVQQMKQQQQQQQQQKKK